MSKYIHTVIIAAVLITSLAPTALADVRPEVVDRLMQGKEGFYICESNLNEERDLANCYPAENSPRDRDTLGAQNDDFLVFVFNVPIEAVFYEHSRYEGYSIELDYSGSGAPQCTYSFKGGGGASQELSCNQARGGRSAFVQSTVDGKSVYALDLELLCIVDSDNTGNDCSNTWGGDVSSYKITSIAGNDTPSDTDNDSGTDGDFSITPDIESPGGEEIPLGLADKVVTFYNWALGIGGLVGLAVIIYGGFLYASSAGNPGRLGEAKAWIQHGLVGLLLLFSSFIILRFINPDLTTIEDIVVTTNPTLEAPRVSIFALAGGYTCPLSGQYSEDVWAAGDFMDCRVPSADGPWPNACPGSQRPHLGVDIRSTTGEPLVAAEAGVVTAIINNDSCGIGVNITGSGSGLTYTYCHLNRTPLVSQGDNVTAGQVVGEVGCTGGCGGPHLHFGIFEGQALVPENYYDPCAFLNRVGCTVTCRPRGTQVPGFGYGL